MKEGYKKTELGWIPEEWSIVKLSDISKSKGEYGIGASASEYVKGNPRYLRISDIGDSSNLLYDDIKGINNSEANRYLLYKGDIVFARTGNTTGKTYLCNEKDGKLVYAGFLIKFSLDTDLVVPEFVKYIVQTKRYWDWIKVMSTRSGQPGINSAEYSKFMLQIAPLKEQKKIADILSTVDSQIDYVDELIEKTKELKKGLMQQLLTRGIGHSKFKKTEVGEIPEEWDIKSFSDICKINQGLQIAIEDRYKVKSENRLPYITIQYINDKSNIDNQYYIENANKSVICNYDDILMTRTGNTGMVVSNEHGVFHNNFFKVEFDRSLFIKDFLVYYLKSSSIQKLITRYAGTTTIPDLKHKDFYRIPVIIPSMKEQQQIADILLSVDRQIEEYEDKKVKLEVLKKGLMQQLLTGKIRVI